MRLQKDRRTSIKIQSNKIRAEILNRRRRYGRNNNLEQADIDGSVVLCKASRVNKNNIRTKEMI
jgi:hypothetical protein